MASPNEDHRLPVNHAEYDASIINANKLAETDLYARLRNPQSNDHIHENQIKGWSVPWYLHTKKKTPFTIDDFMRDTHERLTATCSAQQLISEKQAREPDMQRLLQHWSYLLVREGFRLHKGAVMDEDDRYTSNYALQRVRTSLRDALGTKRALVADSPLHPLWGKRGDWVNGQMGNPLCIIKATTNQQQIVRTLLGSNANLTSTHECLASDIAHEAVPMLLAVDDHNFIFYQVQARQELLKLLKGNDYFDEQLRGASVEKLIDMYVSLSNGSDTRLALLQLDGCPDIMAGEASAIIDAYFSPLLSAKEKNLAELTKLFPIIEYLFVRSASANDKEEFNLVFATFKKIKAYVEVDEKTFKLAGIIAALFDGHGTPKQLSYNL